MPDAIPLWELALNQFEPRQRGAFYGPAAQLSPGAGVLYSGITFPEFNVETGRFSARRGSILILTHECDIDGDNDRILNESFVFAPLIFLDALEEEFKRKGMESAVTGFIANVVSNNVNRLFYLPPPDEILGVQGLGKGALIFWNQLSNTHVSQLNSDDATPICALSEYGLEHADRHFRQHFLRPKSDLLARLR